MMIIVQIILAYTVIGLCLELLEELCEFFGFPKIDVDTSYRKNMSVKERIVTVFEWPLFIVFIFLIIIKTIKANRRTKK